MDYYLLSSHSLTLAYVFPMIDRPGKIESESERVREGQVYSEGLLGAHRRSRLPFTIEKTLPG